MAEMDHEWNLVGKFAYLSPLNPADDVRIKDYFTTAVRTSAGGLTMMLIPRIDGVETKLIKTSYSSSAGTAYVTFDNVMVPVENVIGEVDKGFAIVLSK